MLSRGWLYGELSIRLDLLGRAILALAKRIERRSINADLPDWDGTQPTGARRRTA
jgi:hypothetical protein